MGYHLWNGHGHLKGPVGPFVPGPETFVLHMAVSCLVRAPATSPSSFSGPRGPRQGLEAAGQTAGAPPRTPRRPGGAPEPRSLFTLFGGLRLMGETANAFLCDPPTTPPGPRPMSLGRPW